MTKVTILGQQPTEESLKPIEFLYYLETSTKILGIENAKTKPRQWKNIELVSRGLSGSYDILFAYNDNRQEGALYLGYFNDGVVE